MEEETYYSTAQWTGGKSRRKIGLVGGIRDFGVSRPSEKKAAQELASRSGPDFATGCFALSTFLAANWLRLKKNV